MAEPRKFTPPKKSKVTLLPQLHAPKVKASPSASSSKPRPFVPAQPRGSAQPPVGAKRKIAQARSGPAAPIEGGETFFDKLRAMIAPKPLAVVRPELASALGKAASAAAAASAGVSVQSAPAASAAGVSVQSAPASSPVQTASTPLEEPGAAASQRTPETSKKKGGK